MYELSELQMSIVFEKLLKAKEKLPGIPKFDLVYKEVVCQQGIADFVGLVTKEGVNQLEIFENIQYLESGTLVFSLLKPKANRSKKFLQEKTGLSEKTITKVLKELCKNEMVIEEKKGLYHLSPKVVMPRLDIWALLA